MDVGPAEASLETVQPNALPFTRPAAHLGLKLVDGEGKGIPDALTKLHLVRNGTDVPDIDFKAWKDQNELHTGPDGVLAVDVPSSIGLRLDIHGMHWNGTRRTVQGLAAGEAVDLGEIALSPANRMFGRVLDPKGQPVAKARVSIEEANGSMWGNFGRKQVFTDEQGIYEIGGVRRGRYEIKARAQGFAPLQLDAQEVDQSVGEFELDLHLTTGEQTHGMVTDENGTAIADAEVYLVTFDQPMWFGDYKPPLPDSDPAATSDADGRFTVGGISDDGELYLGAKAEGFGTGYAKKVEANGDAVIRLPRYYSVKGKVVDGKGNPVEDAQVSIEPLEDSEDGFGSRSTHSKEDGSFQLPASPPGSYMVRLTSPFGDLEPQPVQLGPDTEAMKLVLPVQNPLNIRLVDADGNGLAGVEVALNSQDGENDQEMMALMAMGYSESISFSGNFLGGSTGHSVKTDVEGIARFADLEAKRYQMSAELLGYALLEEDLDVSGVPQQEEFTMVQGGILRVRLVDDAGQPVTNVPVGLRTSDEGEDLRQQDTDSAGRAIWNNLEEGEYLVSYRANDANGWWWDNDSEEELAPDQPRVEVVSGEVVDFELLVGDLALLTVVVNRGGFPATDVKVHLKEVQDDHNRFYSNNQEGRPTDGRGEIELPAVQPGKYDIIVKGRKSSPATEERVELYLGPQTIEVNLDGGEVKGSLSGTTGPLAGATVALIPHHGEGSKKGRNNSITVISYASSGGKPSLKFGKSGEEETNTRSDQQGEYHFTDVPDGEWQVVARSEGFGTWTSQPVTMRGGRVVDLGDYRLFPGGVIRGHDRNFVPPETEQDDMYFRWGDSVRLETPSGEMITMSMIDDQGDFIIEDLPEGTYLLRKDGWKSEPIELSAGEQIQMDVPLEEPEEEEEAEKEQ